MVIFEKNAIGESLANQTLTLGGSAMGSSMWVMDEIELEVNREKARNDPKLFQYKNGDKMVTEEDLELCSEDSS